MKRLKTIALLGRDTGLRILEEVLIPHPLLDLQQVFTHQKLTKKEGGGPRPEVPFYKEICKKNAIQLITLDIPAAKQPYQFFSSHENFDLLIALSWRYILPKETLQRFSLACINIHRGELPKYKGSEPVKRAIAANEKKIAITAHHITETLDEGPIICSTCFDLEPKPDKYSDEGYAEIIKEKIKPLYSPLTKLAIETVIHS